MEQSSMDNLPPRHPHMAMVQKFLPRAKPFTKALMLRASRRGDDSFEDPESMIGRANYQEDDVPFEEFVASTAVAISVGVAGLAANNIGINSSFLPESDIPKEAPLIVAFSLCILHSINEFLLGEGVTVNLKLAVIDTAKMHYMFHDNKEASERAFEGVKLFQELQADSSMAVSAWRCCLMPPLCLRN